jgi:hypothetical protein
VELEKMEKINWPEKVTKEVLEHRGGHF